MSTVETRLGIHLDVACDYEECADLAGPLLEQLQSGRYDEMSVVNLQPVSDWRADHRTARKRADRCERRGYQFASISREGYSPDINGINRSMGWRQGRPMSEAYMRWQQHTALPAYPCSRHAIRDYGVLDRNMHLVAYSFVYRCGELALVSQILGHAEHLKNEVMYLLMQGIMRDEHWRDRGGYLVYNRHDSGTDGLRFYKERCGFVPMQVAWCP